MLEQSLYWTDRTSDVSGWFYKTRNEWKAEIGLSRSGQESARARLLRLGFIREKRRGIPARMYFRVEIEAVHKALSQLAGNQPTSRRETSQQDCRKSANKLAGNQPTFKETESTQILPENNHHARGAVSDWLKCKDDLKSELTDAEWELWVRPAYLLKLLSGKVMLIALPPNTKITEAARAGKKALIEIVNARGYSGASFTRYPDDHERERLRVEYPHFYAGMFGKAKEPKDGQTCRSKGTSPAPPRAGNAQRALGLQSRR